MSDAAEPQRGAFSKEDGERVVNAQGSASGDGGVSPAS